MGGLSLVMSLPGAYLYIVKGCRPEDCDEVVMDKLENNDDKSGNGAAMFWLAMYSLVLAYGVYSSYTLGRLMGAASLLMLLPGAYLFVVDGCRPEDCNDD
jgi:hypothetical protein